MVDVVVCVAEVLVNSVEEVTALDVELAMDVVVSVDVLLMRLDDALVVVVVVVVPDWAVTERALLVTPSAVA